MPTGRLVRVAVDDLDVLVGHTQALGHHLREGGLVALAVAVGAGQDLDLAGVGEADLGTLPQAHARAERADDRRRGDAAGLDVAGDADAAQPAAPLGFRLAGREALVVGELERLIQRRLVVARVVHEGHRRLVREGVLRDEVLPAELGRVHPDLARRLVEQDLEQERGLGPAGAAVGVHRRGVGVVGLHVGVDRRRLVLAGQQRRVEVGRDAGAEGGHVGADVRLRVHPQRQDVALLVGRELGVGDVVAAVRVGEEGLAALRGPLHRPAADLLAGPEDDALLAVDEDLGAEAAAHVGRHHAQLVLGRHADEGRDDQPVDVRVLRRDVERVALHAGVVVADRGARLERVRRQAVVGEVDPGDVGGPGDRGVGRRLVADLPVVDQVVRRRRRGPRTPGVVRLVDAGDGRAAARSRPRAPRPRPWPAGRCRRRRRPPGRRRSAPSPAPGAGAGPSSWATRPSTSPASRRCCCRARRP